MLYVSERGCDDAVVGSHEAQLGLTEAFVEVCRFFNARLIPVGPAFVALNNRESNVYLYHPDRIHPSSWGAYLAACVFYAVIFNESPAADVTRYESQRTRAAFDFSSFKRLSELVQQTAWETASAFKSKESAGPATTFGP